MRRASLQFYPGDWQSNEKLRQCTHSEKGAWIDVLCILHDQDEYGIVRWPLRALNRAIFGRIRDLYSIRAKGVLKGADVGERCKPFIYIPRSGRKDGEPVILIPEQDGPIWYSARMVRDEYIRRIRGENLPSPLPSNGEAKGDHPSVHLLARARLSSPSPSPSSSSELSGNHHLSLTREVENGRVRWRDSNFSENQWEKYIEGHPGIKQPPVFLKSAGTGKHDETMEHWLKEKVPAVRTKTPAEPEETRLIRESCLRCHGTNTEIISGKGARPCDHKKVENGSGTNNESS